TATATSRIATLSLHDALPILNREQYGDEPLFKGKLFDARLTNVEEGKKVYRKDGDKYVVAKRNPVYSYDRETIFPRIYSDKGGRSEEHTSELQSRENLVCRLL